MQRRGLLSAILAAGAAPLIVKAGVLMPVRGLDSLTLWGDGVHDDSDALEAWFNGGLVMSPDGALVSGALIDARFALSRTLIVGDVFRRNLSRCELAWSKPVEVGVHFKGAFHDTVMGHNTMLLGPPTYPDPEHRAFRT